MGGDLGKSGFQYKKRAEKPIFENAAGFFTKCALRRAEWTPSVVG